MVKFIPFEQRDPDENRENAEIVQQVHTLRAIEELFKAYGMSYLPPDNIDWENEEEHEQDLFRSATLGLAHAIENHIEDAEVPSNTLRITLGHMFIKLGWEADEFEVKLNAAIDIISEFCQEKETED